MSDDHTSRRTKYSCTTYLALTRPLTTASHITYSLLHCTLYFLPPAFTPFLYPHQTPNSNKATTIFVWGFLLYLLCFCLFCLLNRSPAQRRGLARTRQEIKYWFCVKTLRLYLESWYGRRRYVDERRAHTKTHT